MTTWRGADGDGGRPAVRRERKRIHGKPRGGLALADGSWPVDLHRLFPDNEIRVVASSRTFARALGDMCPDLVILVAPPASSADLRRVSSWIASHRESSALLMTPLQYLPLRLHPVPTTLRRNSVGDPADQVGLWPSGPESGSWLPPVEPADLIELDAGIAFDRVGGAILRRGEPVALRPKEVALLEFLIGSPGRVFSRQELLEHVWHDPAPSVRTVDVHVFWLRGKIERDPGQPKRLLTVRGFGYVYSPAYPAPELADRPVERGEASSA